MLIIINNSAIRRSISHSLDATVSVWKVLWLLHNMYFKIHFRWYYEKYRRMKLNYNERRTSLLYTWHINTVIVGEGWAHLKCSDVLIGRSPAERITSKHNNSNTEWVQVVNLSQCPYTLHVPLGKYFLVESNKCLNVFILLLTTEFDAESTLIGSLIEIQHYLRGFYDPTVYKAIETYPLLRRLSGLLLMPSRDDSIEGWSYWPQRGPAKQSPKDCWVCMYVQNCR